MHRDFLRLHHCSQSMPPFDYNAPAELFLAKPSKGSRTKYRRFATAAEVLRYAVEDLRTPKALRRAPGGR